MAGEFPASSHMIKEDFLRNIVKDYTVTGVTTTNHIFHKHADTIYTLRLERAPHKTHPVTKEGPGGKVDKNEELQKAAHREVCEETRRADGIACAGDIGSSSPGLQHVHKSQVQYPIGPGHLSRHISGHCRR